jgi:hypothetical protein
MFDQFWDFDRLVEDGDQTKRRSRDLTTFCGLFGFRSYVMGMGCRSMGLTHS